MTFWSDLRKAIRQATLVRERLESLIVDIERVGDRLLDHDRRLTRIETMIALARRRQPPSEL
jgi:hypothetical protein